jgi:hypothetical protein
MQQINIALQKKYRPQNRIKKPKTRLLARLQCRDVSRQWHVVTVQCQFLGQKTRIQEN